MKRNLKAETKTIRCIYVSRVVVSTPSGRRYDFLPGQQSTTPKYDARFLLSLQRNQDRVCCSGPGEPIKYFEEVP